MCNQVYRHAANHKDEKKMDTQKTNEKTRLMFTLQYSLERYQAMGNGPKCQEIQRELNALKRGTKNAWTLEGAESVGLFGEELHFQYSKITKNDYFPIFSYDRFVLRFSRNEAVSVSWRLTASLSLSDFKILRNSP